MPSVTRIFAVGLTETEKRLFKGICAISQRRENKLEILGVSSSGLADILLVDTQSAEYESYEKIVDTLVESKPIVYIDGKNPELTNIVRPVEWSRLPTFLLKLLASNTGSAGANRSGLNNPIPIDIIPKEKLIDSDSQDSIIPRILVVDDSLVVREQLKEILQANNYLVTTAVSGEEAIQLFRPEYYHKVLLDVVMPKADGYEVCRKLRAMDSGRKTPIIMLTSKSSPFDKIRGKMAGCEAYLTKPVVMRYLLKKLI